MFSQHKIMGDGCNIPPRSTQKLTFFEGLPEGVSHYDLFQLVQNLEKKIGLSSAAVQHLHYLVSHTREVDWRPGGAPIIYRSVQNTATDRGRTERQIHNLERALHQAGLIQWNDTENYKRFGKRDDKGNIEFAFGVDLTPLGNMYDRLVELNEQHIAYMQAFNDTKRAISGRRRRIISKLNLAIEHGLDVDELTKRFDDLPRVRANMTISSLTNILNQVRGVDADLDRLLEELQQTQETSRFSKETSDPSEQNFRHIQPIVSPQSIDIDCNQGGDDDRKDVGEEFSCGMEHISYEMVIDAASDEFLECISPSMHADKYRDLTDAAARMCNRMGIGRFAWLKAKSTLGDTAAAVAVLIIDRNRAHPLIPVVNPGGVLRGMINKAKVNELHLHRSLIAILKRDMPKRSFGSEASRGDTGGEQ